MAAFSASRALAKYSSILSMSSPVFGSGSADSVQILSLRSLKRRSLKCTVGDTGTLHPAGGQVSLLGSLPLKILNPPSSQLENSNDPWNHKAVWLKWAEPCLST